ncbi:helix-turn-helix transcriptional regulator [Bradyrhizobium sp. LTSP849]|uniref:AraC family transcriptional regulator n=1 Tax=Bradyrhizobium sp. LTSP849 TaxID=1615890 RepID=UPI000A9954C0|nr:helix-turn-helix transcriptional regulator [Bradyrhizobium sp. LTSP849]
MIGICDPIRMWLPKRKLTEPALFKHVDLNGVRIASSSGFDGIKFHFRGHPTFRQLIPLRGVAELQCRGQSFQHSATLSAIVPANEESVLAHGPHFRSLVLYIDEQTLLRKFQAIVGPDSDARPIIFGAVDMTLERSLRLVRAISFACAELDATRGNTPQLVLDELSQLIVVSFLQATESSLLDDADGVLPKIAPRQVKLVAEYIEANWHQPLKLSALANVSGASLRTLFRTFRTHWRETPMEFLRRTRLRHANQRLASAGPSDTVTGIALACGFSNVAHFARHYSQLFGERPIDTLRRRKKHS